MNEVSAAEALRKLRKFSEPEASEPEASERIQALHDLPNSRERIEHAPLSLDRVSIALSHTLADAKWLQLTWTLGHLDAQLDAQLH